MRLVCYDCGATFADDRARCDCGEPLWVDADTAASLPDCAASMWAFDGLLPSLDPIGVGAGAGGTPLVRAPRLDDAGPELWLKDEGRNPTGSFKDRGSALGVARAAADGDAVATVSHGNMATSVAAHAAAADLDCLVLVPADIPAERLAVIGQYDPEVLRVEGDYGRLYYEALAAARDAPVRVLNSDVPLRVEGQKTLAFELAAAFAPGVPDAVVLPVSSGGNASAVWKGFRELAAAGVVDRVPRLYLVQAAATAPVAAAFEAGDDAVTAVEPGETVAYSIGNPDPPSGTRALRAARSTGGAVVAVDDDAIIDARDALAARAGVSAEAASATSLAGLRALADRGEVAPDERVVAAVTGTGFKESGAGDAPDPDTVALGDLGGALATRL